MSDVGSYFTSANMLTIFDMCPYCLDEIRRGVPADGKCGHEQLLIDAGNAPPQHVIDEMKANGRWKG